MFRVMCNKCGKKQLTNPRAKILKWSGKPDLTGKRKTCVYCGKSFKVRDCIIKDGLYYKGGKVNEM